MTERSPSDERFLFDLADLLRICPESVRALREVSQHLGAHLGASRCVFVEIDTLAERATIRGDYASGLTSLVGARPLSTFSPEMVAECRAGRTLVNDDARVDPRTARRYEIAYRPPGIRAYVAVPMMRASQWVSVLLVSTHVPRAWQAREVALIQSVAERTWLWFEHLIALEALRASESRKAAILDSALDAIVTVDHAGTILELNRAAEVAFGHRREVAVGRRMGDLLIPASHRDVFRRALDSCIAPRARPARDATELPVVCADGSERQAEIAITRVPHHEPPVFTAYLRDVTERNRAAGAFHESEERFRLLVEAVRDCAIVLLDPTGVVTTWNAGAERLYGHRADDIVGKHFSQFYTRADVELGKPRQELERAAADGSHEDESWRVRNDGSRLWASVVLSALRDTRGELVGFGKVIRDMTERVRANEQFRLAIEATPTGMIMVDRLGHIVLINAQIEKLFGYTRQELLGQTVDILVPERFRAHHPQHRTAFLADPRTRLMGAGRDLYGLRKDGTELPIEIGLNPFRTPEGEFVLSSIVDITERKRAMDQLRLAIEAAPTGMIMIDGDGKIALINAQVEKLFGYARADLVGQPIEILVPERFRRQHPQFRASFVRDPKFRAMGAGRDLYGLHRDGSEVPIEIGLNPLHTERGDFVLSSVVDITERKRTEREREQLLSELGTLNAELEDRVQRRTAQLSTTLAEREVLLQEVHHRVKNNLQVISSLINMQIRTLEPGAGRMGLQECRTRIEAIALIHEQLYQSRNYARVPFSEYARSLATNILHATGVSPGKITLGVEIDSVSLPVDKAIPCGLILNELMTNALKHAFPGERAGAVRVELRRTDRGDVVLAVGDDGVGMMRDLEPGRSSTLGMQLVTTLVEQLDGRLDVDRRNGTTFRITFPLEQDAVPLGPALS